MLFDLLAWEHIMKIPWAGENSWFAKSVHLTYSRLAIFFLTIYMLLQPKVSEAEVFAYYREKNLAPDSGQNSALKRKFTLIHGNVIRRLPFQHGFVCKAHCFIWFYVKYVNSPYCLTLSHCYSHCSIMPTFAICDPEPLTHIKTEITGETRFAYKLYRLTGSPFSAPFRQSLLIPQVWFGLVWFCRRGKKQTKHPTDHFLGSQISNQI